jgi:ATP-binding cassette subfamily B protein
MADNKNNNPMPMGRGGRHNRGVPVQKPQNMGKTLRRLWQYISVHKIKLFLAILFVAATTLISLFSTRMIGSSIDKYVLNGDFSTLGMVIAVLVVLYVLSSVLTWSMTQLCVNLAQNTVHEIRRDLFDKMQTLPLRFYDTHAKGDMMSRITNDVDTIGNSLNVGLMQVIQSFLTIVGILAFMLMLSPVLTLVALLAIPVIFLITKFITKRSRVYFKEQQRVLGALNGNIEETITGIKAVKVFVKEEDELEEMDKLNTELKTVGALAQIYSGIMGPCSTFVNSMSYGMIAVVGALCGISVGTITSFLLYSRQFSRPFNEIATQYNQLLSAIAGAERVFEIMDEEQEFEDEPNAVELTNIEGRVDLENVYFSYEEGQPILKNINLYAKPSQTIALVGPTGAGKTTIINLLTRFYDIQSGVIRIDGIDIRHIKKASLRSSLGIVLQDSYLFSGTIMENIRYGRLDATDSEVKSAAILAQAHEFIRRLPMGYDTEISEDSDTISQGQKQMITIARAILSNPSILILDEATSNVDTRTEQKIQQAMLNLMKGRTSFVIAHRLSTIQNADLIAVINHGEIIERGNHRELLEKQGFYYNLYMNQFSE